MFGATAFLASAISAAAMPQDVLRKIFATYPRWAVAERRSAAARIDLLVNPDGTVRECQVVEFVGNERLAREKCASLEQFRLDPAKGPSGAPMYGKLRTTIALEIDVSRDRNLVRRWKPAPDLSVTGLLPESAGQPVDVAVIVFVAADGTIRECTGDASKNEEVPSSLVDAACAEAAKGTLPPLTVTNDQPIEHVTNMTVRFETSAK